METSVRAAVVSAFGQPLELREVPVSDVEPGALLIRVDAATLCGTAVHFWHGAADRAREPAVRAGASAGAAGARTVAAGARRAGPTPTSG